MVNHNRKVVIVKEFVQGSVRDFGSVGGVDVVIRSENCLHSTLNGLQFCSGTVVDGKEQYFHGSISLW